MPKTYFVQVRTSHNPAGPYIAPGRDGIRFPHWTWQQPAPLSLEDAEALKQAALRICDGILVLHSADD